MLHDQTTDNEMPPRESSPTPEPICGLLVVDKPLDWSSMHVVRRVRRAAGGAKTGHAGTLDPLATGVVVCCLGKATRCVEQIMGQTKIYEAEIDLSAFTATDDREAAREEVAVATPPTPEAVLAALAAMIGWIAQTPPAHSAIHVGGQRAYKLARQGKTVDLPPRQVRIDAIDLLNYAWPVAKVKVTCGRGTYIRSLARDLGKALGTGGHLASLRRTAVGSFTLEQAVTAERLDQPITQADLLPALPQ
ncbi:MAG: tRNA pseudouridine(55) synthase TruB [Phycisphaeraceae bacterium]|nr:tRNA pseudouridine(55) synthase TruB [Phycisphaeraceae bacterium]